jgi:hypothetical protein
VPPCPSAWNCEEGPLPELGRAGGARQFLGAIAAALDVSGGSNSIPCDQVITPGAGACGEGGGLRAGDRQLANHPTTKTQKLRPAFSVNTQPNHVPPLAHFGATSGVCDGGVVRTYHHTAGERSGSTQQYDLEVHHAHAGGW